MKAITLRNLPPGLVKLIEQEAEQSGLSLNRTVIRLLEKNTDFDARERGERTYDDLDHLEGSWSEAEAVEFDRVLAEQRRIDPELWE